MLRSVTFVHILTRENCELVVKSLGHVSVSFYSPRTYFCASLLYIHLERVFLSRHLLYNVINVMMSP